MTKNKDNSQIKAKNQVCFHWHSEHRKICAKKGWNPPKWKIPASSFSQSYTRATIISNRAFSEILQPKNEVEKKAMQEYQVKQLAKRYNNFRYTCPMCGSHLVMNIPLFNKTVSAELFGLASNQIGKCYECGSCKYRW